ncbi:MAG: hypothetical protein JWL77_5502, partial [Chthonomonadaceae bacterium]|nr:hypothetical protein [Chthonomonadaceae bacterium]
RIGDVWAVEALCSALKDREPDVRLSAGRALDLMGTADTLPLRVLSSMTLTPAKLLDTLQALTDASPRIMKSADRHENTRMPVRYVRKPVRYQIGDVATFCERVCRHIDSAESMKRNAAAVLAELQNRAAAGTLLRASTRSDAPEKEELLRGASGSPDLTPSEEMLRAADASSENPSPEKPGLLTWIFKRK